MKKGTILLIVSDKQTSSYLNDYLLQQNFEVLLTETGIDGLKKLFNSKVDIIILEINLEDISGIEVLKRIKNNNETQDIPVIILSSLTDNNLRIEALANEANEFLLKPFDKVELLVRVRNLMNIKKTNDLLKQKYKTIEKNFKEKIENIQKDFKELSFSNKKIKEGYLETIFRLSVIAEYKDKQTAVYHIKRMSYYAAIIADMLDFKPEEKEAIFYAAPMHDIGKIEIPEHILTKPRKLTKDEFAIMELHTTIGAKILSGSNSQILKTASIISLSHHEKWDATGYPLGLEGENIPIEGRIISLIDQYDTLRTQRVYGSNLDHETAVRIITQGDGRTLPSHFDPRILKIFKENSSKFDEVFRTINPFTNIDNYN